MKTKNEQNWINVKSSQIKRVAFIPAKQSGMMGELLIEFSTGGIYRYHDFDPAKFEQMMKAESIGKYFHAFVRGKHGDRRVSDAELKNLLAIIREAQPVCPKCNLAIRQENAIEGKPLTYCTACGEDSKEWGIYNLDGGRTFWLASSVEEARKDEPIDSQTAGASLHFQVFPPKR